jgi:hypothetical protein
MMMEENFQSAHQRYDSARQRRRNKFKQNAAIVMPRYSLCGTFSKTLCHLNI